MSRSASSGVARTASALLACALLTAAMPDAHGTETADTARQSAPQASAPGHPGRPGGAPLDALPAPAALPGRTAPLDRTDEIATLEALHQALSEVADGSTFVWHRAHGRLSGLVQPTASFKDADGQICRHVVMMLTSSGYTRRAEGIACRQSNGGWTLDG